jgi:hypothetical protein
MGALKEKKNMLLKLMGTLALLSTNAVNHAPQSASKQVTPKVVASTNTVKSTDTKSTGTQVARAEDKKVAPAKSTEMKPSETKSNEVQVAKAEDKKAEPAKTESTDGGTPAPKTGGGKK